MKSEIECSLIEFKETVGPRRRYVLDWVSFGFGSYSHVSSRVRPQTVCWARWMTTWKRRLIWIELASWTCKLASATPTPMRFTCGTRMTSWSPSHPKSRARCPALWWPSSLTYPHSCPTPSASGARATISHSRRRVTHEWKGPGQFSRGSSLLSSSVSS